MNNNNNNNDINEIMINISIVNYLEMKYKNNEWFNMMKKDLMMNSINLIDNNDIKSKSIIINDDNEDNNKDKKNDNFGDWILLEKKYGINSTLDEIFNVGLSYIGSSFMFANEKKSMSSSSTSSFSVDKPIDFVDDPRYIRYKRKIEEKGFFQGAEVGSEEYERRMKKLNQTFIDKVLNVQNEGSGTKSLTKEEKEERVKQADQLKEQGNNSLKAEDYEKAVEFYSQAINTCPNDDNSNNDRISIYLSNRSAAYTHLKKYEDALEDCKASVSLNPGYIKAHSRLATAYYSLEQYDEAIEASKKTLELQPDNESAKSTLEMSQKALNKKKKKISGDDDDDDDMDIYSGSASKNNANKGGAGGMPDLASMMSQFGGMDFNAMMQDPNIMNSVAQMASDPKFASLLGGLGGGKR